MGGWRRNVRTLQCRIDKEVRGVRTVAAERRETDGVLMKSFTLLRFNVVPSWTRRMVNPMSQRIIFGRCESPLSSKLTECDHMDAKFFA